MRALYVIGLLRSHVSRRQALRPCAVGRQDVKHIYGTTPGLLPIVPNNTRDIGLSAGNPCIIVALRPVLTILGQNPCVIEAPPHMHGRCGGEAYGLVNKPPSTTAPTKAPTSSPTKAATSMSLHGTGRCKTTSGGDFNGCDGFSNVASATDCNEECLAWDGCIAAEYYSSTKRCIAWTGLDTTFTEPANAGRCWKKAGRGTVLASSTNQHVATACYKKTTSTPLATETITPLSGRVPANGSSRVVPTCSHASRATPPRSPNQLRAWL